MFDIESDIAQETIEDTVQKESKDIESDIISEIEKQGDEWYREAEEEYYKSLSADSSDSSENKENSVSNIDDNSSEIENDNEENTF
jgi:hypothetical protein